MSTVLALWWGLVFFAGLPETILPGPLTVFGTTLSQAPRLLLQMGVTLGWTLVGFGLSLAAALVLGWVLTRFSILEKLFQPFFLLSQTIPTVTLFPLLMIWLGWGPEPRIVVVLLTCGFPILIAFLQGIKSADKLHIDLLRSLGATDDQIFWKVQFPSSLVALFAGVRISAVYAILAMVVGEWMGGQEGIGVYMLRSLKSFQTAQVFAAILFVSVSSISLYSFVSQIEKAVLSWRQKESL